MVIPSILLLTGIVFYRKKIKTKSWLLVAVFLVSILTLRSADVYIRGLFHFADNHFMNAYLDLYAFGLFSVLLFLALRKRGFIAIDV